MDTTTIYVSLLNEGTLVFRPVLAQKISDDVYRINDDNLYDPDIEEWEFLPGNYVLVTEKEFSGQKVLVASSLYDDN